MKSKNIYIFQYIKVRFNCSMLLAEIIFNYYIRFKSNIVKPIIQDPPTSHKI